MAPPAGVPSGFIDPLFAGGRERGPRLSLTCKSCGHEGWYHVGLIAVDREKVEAAEWRYDDLRASPFGFIRYFRCESCDAAGPWSISGKSQVKLQMFSLAGILSGDRRKAVVMKMALFDGTEISTSAEGVDLLRRRIEADPDNPFLYDRLGNLFRTGGRVDLALDSFQEALRLDQDFILSLHSAGALLLARGNLEEAAKHLHRFIVSIRDERNTGRVSTPELRALTRDVLENLLAIHSRSREVIPVFPDEIPRAQTPGAKVRWF